LDRVLVQRVQAPTKSVGGVFLPESSQTRINEGIVLATGPGRLNKDGQIIPLAVKAGDKVLLPEYGGNTVKVEQEEYTIYRDEDILAVLKQ
jgi:chaperonin GroES